MENQTRPPTMDELLNRMKRMLAMEILENHLPELLNEGTVDQAIAVDDLVEELKEVSHISTFAEFLQELQEQGHDPIGAVFYVLDAYNMDDLLRRSLKHVLGQIPTKGWME